MSYSGIQESYKFAERASPIRSNEFDRAYSIDYESTRDSARRDYTEAIKFLSHRANGKYGGHASEGGHSLGGDVRIVSRAA